MLFLIDNKSTHNSGNVNVKLLRSAAILRQSFTATPRSTTCFGTVSIFVFLTSSCFSLAGQFASSFLLSNFLLPSLNILMISVSFTSCTILIVYAQSFVFQRELFCCKVCICVLSGYSVVTVTYHIERKTSRIVSYIYFCTVLATVSDLLRSVARAC